MRHIISDAISTNLVEDVAGFPQPDESVWIAYWDSQKSHWFYHNKVLLVLFSTFSII